MAIDLEIITKFERSVEDMVSYLSENLPATSPGNLSTLELSRLVELLDNAQSRLEYARNMLIMQPGYQQPVIIGPETPPIKPKPKRLNSSSS